MRLGERETAILRQGDARCDGQCLVQVTQCCRRRRSWSRLRRQKTRVMTLVGDKYYVQGRSGWRHGAASSESVGGTGVGVGGVVESAGRDPATEEVDKLEDASEY